MEIKKASYLFFNHLYFKVAVGKFLWNSIKKHVKGFIFRKYNYWKLTHKVKYNILSYAFVVDSEKWDIFQQKLQVDVNRGKDLNRGKFEVKNLLQKLNEYEKKLSKNEIC